MTVMVAVVDKEAGTLKDTARNITEFGEFVINIPRGAQLEALVATSGDFPSTISELDAVGLGTQPAATVAPPRIAGCAAHLECRLIETHRYGRDHGTTVLVAEVIHVAIDDTLQTPRGLLDTVAAQIPARLGGSDYLRVTEVFQQTRPEV